MSKRVRSVNLEKLERDWLLASNKDTREDAFDELLCAFTHGEHDKRDVLGILLQSTDSDELMCIADHTSREIVESLKESSPLLPYIRGVKLTNRLNYNLNSSLDFGRSPQMFVDILEDAMKYPIGVQKRVLRDICSSPGRCANECLEALCQVEPTLSDELWKVIEAEFDFPSFGWKPLPGTSERMKRLMGNFWVKATDVGVAMRAVADFDLDPLNLPTDANPEVLRLFRKMSARYSLGATLGAPDADAHEAAL